MKVKRRWMEYAGILFLLVIALVCVLSVSFRNPQASMPVPMPQSFIGEYSYDQINWSPLTDEADLSAKRGDLYLRGHFERDMPEGVHMWYYRNHIGVTIYINGERAYIDTQTQLADIGKEMGAFMCGREWCNLASRGITQQDQIEIRLYNPHQFGNETAYRDFLSTLCGDTPGVELLPKELESYGEWIRFVSGLCVIVALMILGAAVASVLVHIPVGGGLLKQGLLTLFASGFIYMDTIDISFKNELVGLNTYGRQLCMMLAVFFLGSFISDFLTGAKKKLAKVALSLSFILNCAIILASLGGLTTIYGAYPYWAAYQLILCPLLWICCAMELFAALREKWLISITGMLMFAGILLDIFGVVDHIIWRNCCSKLLFMALFILHLLLAVRKIAINQRATMHAARLEKELENSRIAIMLSQIQPHFLYNVLGTIRGLCREDPMQARLALEDFSDYLRGNMNALSNNTTIHFTSELRHIEAYLRLEKMRMGSRLNILYDIQEKNFFIPPLTIQPLVENAVKHGLFEKGSGTLQLKTQRQGDQIVISVQDDGIGFDENAPLLQDDHHAHVGLINVRNRLEKISSGRLVIDSAPGRGTTATVFLHTDIMENGGKDLYEHSGH